MLSYGVVIFHEHTAVHSSNLLLYAIWCTACTYMYMYVYCGNTLCSIGPVMSVLVHCVCLFVSFVCLFVALFIAPPPSQIDNPVSLLNQDTSRNFLRSSNPEANYKLFMKATHLEQIVRDYESTQEEQGLMEERIQRNHKVWSGFNPACTPITAERTRNRVLARPYQPIYALWSLHKPIGIYMGHLILDVI